MVIHTTRDMCNLSKVVKKVQYKAIVRFLSPKEGGARINPPRSGYHPHLKVGDEYTSCMIQLQGADDGMLMDFDMEHQVLLTLLFPDYHSRIDKDLKLEFYEGNRLVGIGKLINQN